MTNIRKALTKQPLITALAALIVAFVLLLTIPTNGTVLQNLRQEVPLTALTLLLLLGIGGLALLRPSGKGIAYTFKKSWLYLVPGIVIAASTVLRSVASSEPMQTNWPALLLEAVIFYFLLGFFEEGLFRGVIMHALLPKLGRTRRGLITAVAISGFIFGFVHILLSWFQTGIDLSGWGLAQAFVKTLSAGMAGFFFGSVYLKTKTLWGVALVHGLSDFLLMVGSLLFSGSNAVSYVSADPKQALSSLLVNSVFILIYIPLVISAVRQLRTIELPQTGFYINKQH